MYQFRSGLRLADPAGYARTIQMAREVLAYARVRKSELAANIALQDERAQWEPRRRLKAETDDNLRLFIENDVDAELSVVIRRTDLYLISVHNSHAGFYFSDTQERMRTQDAQVSLPFSGSYVALGRFGRLPRLDAGAIQAAVNAVVHWRSSDKISNLRQTAHSDEVQSAEARHLLILILVTSEAIRLRPVERTILRALGDTTAVGLGQDELDAYVRNWEQRSQAAERAGVPDPDLGLPAM